MKYCYLCNKAITDPDHLGVNYKMLGKRTKRTYCFACLAKELGITEEYLMKKVHDWKEQGCVFFNRL